MLAFCKQAFKLKLIYGDNDSRVNKFDKKIVTNNY